MCGILILCVAADGLPCHPGRPVTPNSMAYTQSPALIKISTVFGLGGPSPSPPPIAESIPETRPTKGIPDRWMLEGIVSPRSTSAGAVGAVSTSPGLSIPSIDRGFTGNLPSGAGCGINPRWTMISRDSINRICRNHDLAATVDV